MAKPKYVSEADKALLERAVAAGCDALRDDDGRIVALFLKRVRMSAADCKRLREMCDESDADFRAYGGRIVSTPNPANLVGGAKRYYAMPEMTDTQLDDVIKVDRFTDAEQRIENLKRHAELREIAEKLACAMPKEEGMLDKRLRAVIPNAPFWAELAYAEMLAVAYDAAPRVIRDNKRQSGTKRGGIRAGCTAKSKAAEWQTECINLAHSLLVAGRQLHELAGILAQRYGRTDRQVRSVLQKDGLLPTRSKKTSDAARIAHHPRV